MKSFSECMLEYKSQMEKGIIITAYKGLMEYIMGLRTHFHNKYPDISVSGNIYHGCMDMTFFSLVPELFKQRKLKFAVVFLHETCRFEVWLAGTNKQIQSRYLEFFRGHGLGKYRLGSAIRGTDSIVEFMVADNPEFDNLPALTGKIEHSTLEFIKDIEITLLKHDN